MTFWVHQSYHEVVQFRNAESIKEHFTIWNLNDAIRLILTPVVVLGVMPNDLNRAPWSVVAAIATFSMMLKAIDWMRLFDLTSFYIHLIG